MSPYGLVLVLLFAFASHLAAAYQAPSPPAPPPPQHDAQAVAILQQSVAGMAPASPADSSATGTVTIVEGSTTQSGTIKILTLGATQTSETLDLPDGQRTVVYSNGASKEIYGTKSSNPAMQAVLTDQCLDFPLPFLASTLANADEYIRYVGPETLNGQSVEHIQVWNSFASKPHLQKLAPFSLKDVWIADLSGLPVKIAYARRVSGGLAPSIPVEVLFSHYSNVNGIVFPFQIEKSMNGMPWQTITIETVSFSTGLTAAQFQVQ